MTPAGRITPARYDTPAIRWALRRPRSRRLAFLAVMTHQLGPALLVVARNVARSYAMAWRDGVVS